MENNTKPGKNDDHNLDDLFRETLSDHRVEPSTGLWKGISRKLMWREISRFNFTNFSRLAWIGGTSIVVVGTIVAYLFIQPEPKITPSLPTQAIVVEEPKPDIIVVSPAPSKLVAAVTHSAVSPAASSLKTASLLPEKSVTPATPEPTPRSTPSSTGVVTNPVPSVMESHMTSTLSLETPLILDTQPMPDLTGGILADTLRLSVPGVGDMLVLREKIPIANFFSASFAISPELSVYKSGSANYEMNYWMNLGAAYHISRFSIASGLSLGYIFDDGKYRIDYRSKDSVGYYENVTGFIVNPDNPGEIIYKTELKNVYDSIQHVADDRTRNRYTYIQVPLLFGYRFLETSRLGLTLQAGPAVSFLVGRREAEPYVNYPNARIIRITDNTPARSSVSWQLWVSLRFDYQINKSISIFAEPTYKYSFRVYEPDAEGTTTSTNSFGMGIGLQFNFGKRNK
ncbi:MAG: outer membrane beta-barrel protein [bacterium]